MTNPTLTIRGSLGGRTLAFPLGDGVHEIGRGSTCEIRLDEPSVSRLHARLQVAGGSVRLEDLGSSNGTRLNGQRLTGPTEVRSGDTITLGNVSLKVDDSAGDAGMYLAQTQVRAGLAVSLDEARETRASERSKKAYLFRILAEAGEVLTRRLEPREIFEPLVELVDKALQPDRIFLLLRDEGNTELRTAASRVRAGGPGGMILSRTLVTRVLEQRTAFLTEDASQDQRLLGGDSIVGAGTRSAMAAPLFDNQAVIGLLYADTSDPAVRYDLDELKAFVLLANMVAVAITQARYHAIEEERRRLRTELDAARRIMVRLLPSDLPPVAGLQMVGHLDACEEVAGDLYDVRPLPDGRVLLVVGDVSGKGLSAALLVAALLPAIRTVALECGDLGRLAARVNEQLFESTDAVRFATLFLGQLDPRTGRLEYVNAGHNPPLVVGPGGEITPLAAVGPPVGMLPEFTYPVRTYDLAPGSRLVLYSDGLTEAMNGSEDMYGDERLQALLSLCPDCSVTELRGRVLQDVAAFVDGAPKTDDLTLLVVERDREPT
ncbi:MAG TPA: SpoIIE family protein phosphatase [Candidatus Krumholzibacteria bacterium]|nr:SpoIIE family protein phosphatase [Candidatus Krumholzibacteria bacterium]HPD70387.1 SpoIIE family protein phosphatase [Candidatus Krumholzibacteria bacterium]HRY39913.1 SpoIIE family protein phosphatase [Candidatus Krumholzibacteria bacterium]